MKNTEYVNGLVAIAEKAANDPNVSADQFSDLWFAICQKAGKAWFNGTIDSEDRQMIEDKVWKLNNEKSDREWDLENKKFNHINNSREIKLNITLNIR